MCISKPQLGLKKYKIDFLGEIIEVYGGSNFTKTLPFYCELIVNGIKTMPSNEVFLCSVRENYTIRIAY